ncbi:MAG: hypothetical protein LBQ54_05910 [Planctomycetaceae bacterium]|nr:hypothetical protein [Planctomycetaceae bacterium]
MARWIALASRLRGRLSMDHLSQLLSFCSGNMLLHRSLPPNTFGVVGVG